MTLQKPDGGILPILRGEVWIRCFTILSVDTTTIHNETDKLFTSSYDNFIQTPGIRDDDSHCAKILIFFYANLDVSDMSVTSRECTQSRTRRVENRETL
jgi:hypothetical protein